MIWKGSKEVGTGKAVAANGWVYIVSLYYPSGNVVGQFKKNVFEPSYPDYPGDPGDQDDDADNDD
jgi:hypothetical protein